MIMLFKTRGISVDTSVKDFMTSPSDLSCRQAPAVEDRAMKIVSLLLVLITATLYANTAGAFADAPPLEKDAQICFGYAMVGYDSVINSRLGGPAEYALGL